MRRRGRRKGCGGKASTRRGQEAQAWDQALTVQYKVPCTALGRQKDVLIIGRVAGECSLAFGNRMQERRGSDATWQHLSFSRVYI